MKTKHTVLTRLLPKTGCNDVVSTGDDGTYQAGWWKGLTLAGNRTRFIPKTIGGDDVVIDRATGLMWPASFGGGGANNGNKLGLVDAIAFCEVLNFAGFNDWRLPNLHEFLSIVNFGVTGDMIYTDYFTGFPVGYLWTSTHSDLWVDDYYSVEIVDGEVLQQAFISLNNLLAVRGGV